MSRDIHAMCFFVERGILTKWLCLIGVCSLHRRAQLLSLVQISLATGNEGEKVGTTALCCDRINATSSERLRPRGYRLLNMKGWVCCGKGHCESEFEQFTLYFEKKVRKVRRAKKRSQKIVVSLVTLHKKGRQDSSQSMVCL